MILLKNVTKSENCFTESGVCMLKVKDGIFEAFEELLKEKSFEDITILDIAKRCEISRGTFYRYFADKYELMNYGYIKKSNALISAYDGINMLKNNYLAMANYMYKKESFRKIFMQYGQNSLTDTISMTCNSICRELVLKSGEKENSDELSDAIEMFSIGMAEYLRHWALNGYKVTPERIAVAIFENIPAKLMKYL